MAKSINNPSEEQSWSQVWQMPALVLGVLMLALGVFVAFPQQQEDGFGSVMDEVALFLAAENLDSAKQLLKEQLEPRIDQAKLYEQARYEMLWGDLIHQQQGKHGWDLVQNHEKIKKHYQKARAIGRRFDGVHLQRLAEAYVALGRDDDAMGVIDELKDEPAHRRYQLIKKIIERRLQAGADVNKLMPLLARYESELTDEADPKAKRAGALWSVAVTGKGLLAIGDAQQTVSYLQRRMIGFMAQAGDQDLASLQVLMGKAWYELGEYEEAQRWYRLAQQRLLAADLLNADVLVGLAAIELAQTGDVRAALENFSAAETEYPTAPAYLEALIGRADCEARLGAHPEAIDHFNRAVKRLGSESGLHQRLVDDLTEVVQSNYELNSARQQDDLALEYLSVLKPLYKKKIPANLLIEFAQVHERIAQQYMDQANSESEKVLGAGASADDLLLSKRVAWRQASVHYAKAGEYYLLHSQALANVDVDVFGQSLWKAADSYDKAQLWDKAIEYYARFVKLRPKDPLHLEAIYRLGVAYHSDHQFTVAVQMFNRLLEEHSKSPEAYKSLVPLARSHIALDDKESAQRVLRHVITDHPAITPVSRQYQEALIELGKLLYRQQAFEPAIEKLSEAVERYGDSRDGPMLRFYLADAYRRSIEQLDEQIQEPMARSKQLAMQVERARRLEEAQNIFSRVISEFEAVEPRALSAVERLSLRNAYFYRADCAYDLGRYEQAIALYDLAAKRWESHPSSLVALVQIVNAYCELGKIQEAKVANDRARWQLQRIPEDAFDDQSLPMTRQHWQDWLRWTSELRLFDSQANATVKP